MSATDSHRLICAEIWGGNGAARSRVAMPGLTGVLYANPCGGEEGGDIYYTSACVAGLMARFILADVTGHGSEVAEVSGWVHDVFRHNINQSDPAAILSEVNQRAFERGLASMTTAACFSYYATTGDLRYSYAGHPPAFAYDCSGAAWTLLELPENGSPTPRNVALGVIPDGAYDVGVRRLDAGDRLFVYSDGVTEAPGPNGDLYGQDGVLELLNKQVHLDCVALGDYMFDALAHAAGTEQFVHDDVTALICEAGPHLRGPTGFYLVKNRLCKLFRGHRA